MDVSWVFNSESDCWTASLGSLELVVSHERDGWAWDVYGDMVESICGSVCNTLDDALFECEIEALCMIADGRSSLEVTPISE